jgi:hypothetical protein
MDEEHLELFVEVVVEDAAVEEAGDLEEDAAPRLFESLLELGIGPRTCGGRT